MIDGFPPGKNGVAQRAILCRTGRAAGKIADFVILSDNPVTVPQDQLADIKVLETIKEGVSIYKRAAQSDGISSPAIFGVTIDKSYGVCHGIHGYKPVCGDGCFNQ